MGILLVFSPGVSTIWEEKTTVGLVHGETHMVSLGKYNGVRGRVQPKILSSKILRSGVK